MKSYRDLEVYKESKRLAEEVHKVSLTLPKFGMFEEGSQVRRTSKSETAMIAEGCGRRRYQADGVEENWNDFADKATVTSNWLLITSYCLHITGNK